MLTPDRPRDPDFLDRLRELAPDACPVVAYGALIPRAALDIPRHGWVNLHFSLLPAWRGAAPVQHAVMAGDEVTGASTFLIEEGLDTGPVFGVMTERVRPRDTAGDLLGGWPGRCRTAGGDHGRPRGRFADARARRPPRGVAGAEDRGADARVRWDRPAVAVDRQVRGCTPAPGAWATFRGERVKLLPVELDEGYAGSDLAPGELAAGKREVHVGTATGPVRLSDVRPHGKKEMTAADWARGVRIDAGERFSHE